MKKRVFFFRNSGFYFSSSSSSSHLAFSLFPRLIQKTFFPSWGVGQAWGYRRRAFAAMARAVGGPGARKHAEVMAKEPEGASREYEWPGWGEQAE